MSRVFCPAHGPGTLSWPSANSPCVRAKNRLDFVPALARAGSLRRWSLPYPKPSPWGEGAPVRTLGRMRGRPCTQPFLVEKRGAPDCRLNGIFLLLRWASRSPPHPSPSVTASPQGEASGLCSPTRKSVPNQGTQMDSETAPPPEQCATTAKTSECQRAGPKKGGPGGLPPALFLPISREKWGPRRAGGAPGALRPEAPEKPRPPEGYAVPHRTPARDRAGTNVAGSTLRWFQRNRLPMTEAPGPSGATPTPSGQMKEKPPGKGSRFCASCPFFVHRGKTREKCGLLC